MRRDFFERILLERKRRIQGASPAEGRADPPLQALSEEQKLLYWAVLGDVEHARHSLSNGANINWQEAQHGDTALMKAVMNRHPKIVQLLLRCVADVSIENRRHGQCATALQIARTHSTVEIQRMLSLAEEAQKAGVASVALSASEKGEDLWFAATEDDAPQVACLLHSGIVVNARHGSLGETALMGAAAWGAESAVNSLANMHPSSCCTLCLGLAVIYLYLRMSEAA
eukprot:SAG25_NODE_556_length_6947_cov_7.702242_6_plen_228_part_00